MKGDDVREMPDRASKIGHRMFDEANKATMAALVANNGGPGEGLFIGAMGVLGAAVTAAGVGAKRPEGISHLSAKEDQVKAMVSMTNYETVLFAALLATRMFQETVVDPSGDGFSTRSDYSPEAIHLALEDWKKLTGKDPIDYLHTGMVEMDRRKFDGSDAKLLAEFLAKRPGAHVSPGSGTAQ